jgi:hypothetical protein
VPSIVNGQLVQGDGTPAEQIPDFWRVGLGATGALPDGTTDVTDVIAHQSDIFVGLDALMRVGHGAGNLPSNTAVGNSTLNANTTGNSNTASGASALRFNTTGSNNTASGASALYSNTTGGSNTANGTNALYSNTTGNSNTASGVNALYSNTTGNSNIASGVNALYYNQESQNTAIGDESFNSFNLLLSSATMTASSATQVTLSAPMTPSPAAGSFVTIINVGGYANSISGLVIPKSYKVVNDTTLEVTDAASQILGTTGTATNFEIRQSKGYTNSTAAGYDAEPTASNQVKLGNTAVTEINLGNNLIIDVAAILGAADGTQLVKRIVGGIHKITI